IKNLKKIITCNFFFYRRLVIMYILHITSENHIAINRLLLLNNKLFRIYYYIFYFLLFNLKYFILVSYTTIKLLNLTREGYLIAITNHLIILIASIEYILMQRLVSCPYWYFPLLFCLLWTHTKSPTKG